MSKDIFLAATEALNLRGYALIFSFAFGSHQQYSNIFYSHMFFPMPRLNVQATDPK